MARKYYDEPKIINPYRDLYDGKGAARSVITPVALAAVILGSLACIFGPDRIACSARAPGARPRVLQRSRGRNHGRLGLIDWIFDRHDKPIFYFFGKTLQLPSANRS